MYDGRRGIARHSRMPLTALGPAWLSRVWCHSTSRLAGGVSRSQSFRRVFWGALAAPGRPYAVTHRTNHSPIGLFRRLDWASHSMPPSASHVSLASPCSLRPASARGRRRAPGVGAPPPLVWACTAAPVLGLFRFRCQGLEKRLGRDHRRLAGKDLLHEDTVDFLIRVGTAILEHDERIVGIVTVQLVKT